MPSSMTTTMPTTAMAAIVARAERTTAPCVMAATADHAVTAAGTMTDVTTSGMGATTACAMTTAAEYAVPAAGTMTTVDASTVSAVSANAMIAGMSDWMASRDSTVGDMDRCIMMQAGVVWCRMMQADNVMIK